MSKTLYMSEIPGIFFRCKDISVTSHTPQLFASNCFLSEKRNSKVGFEFSNSIFAIWKEVGFFGWSQQSESMWIIFVFFNIDDIDLEMNSVAKRYANYIFLWRRLKVIFQTYRMTTPSTGNKHDIFVTVSEFSLDSKWSTVNVSVSSFLKLQLSRLFVNRSVVFLHFDTASESTGTGGSLSKVEKSLNLKSKFPYRFTYKAYFLFGGMFMGDEEEMKSWPGFPGSISLFHVT